MSGLLTRPFDPVVASRLAAVALAAASLALSGCFDDRSAGGPAAPTSVAPNAGDAAQVPGNTGNTANSAPQLSGTPAAEIPTGFPYVFRPAAQDPDGDTLSFTVSGKPTWASFDVRSGELRGVPGDRDVGVATGIVITASDGRAASTLGPFQVRVNRSPTLTAPTASTAVGARPPTISGTPAATASAGSGYLFQIVASDPDGDKLTYGALNLPPWLGINSANGTVTGTPTATQAGQYPNIVISVTDGRSTASLAPFTLTVSAPAVPAGGGAGGSAGGSAGGTTTATASATLSWVPPTTYTDGAPLVDLAGYRIKYGRDPAALTPQVTLAAPGTTRHIVTALGSGTWYFAVVAYTSGGIESAVSAVVSKTIP